VYSNLQSVSSSQGYEEDDTVVVKPKSFKTLSIDENANVNYEFKKEFEKEVMGHRKVL
jgi:hypothetical protein